MATLPLGRTDWAQVFDGPGRGNGTFGAFGGVPNDVYAVGMDRAPSSTSMGGVWRRLRVPDPAEWA